MRCVWEGGGGNGVRSGDRNEVSVTKKLQVSDTFNLSTIYFQKMENGGFVEVISNSRKN